VTALQRSRVQRQPAHVRARPSWGSHRIPSSALDAKSASAGGPAQQDVVRRIWAIDPFVWTGAMKIAGSGG
jgi:hypothetical protein